MRFGICTASGMRPKDFRIRFLPVNDCAIRAPLGRAERFPRAVLVHASTLGSNGAPRNRGGMPFAGRWKSLNGEAFRRPFALVGGRRTAPRGECRTRPAMRARACESCLWFERKAYLVARRGEEKRPPRDFSR